MRHTIRSCLTALCLVPAAAGAQQGVVPIPFEGGAFTITENAEMKKILAYEGKEIVSDYVVFLERMAEVDGTRVALFAVGAGGNACGTSTVIAWRAKGGIETATVGDDCGAPPPAVSARDIVFVPYLVPGTRDLVRRWSPGEGLTIAGVLAFTPQPGTGWADLAPARINHPLEFFDNAGFYAAAAGLLGDELEQYATGLSTAAAPERNAAGFYVATGCVPHACGINDSFLAYNPDGNRIWLAQQADQGDPMTWPGIDGWPDEVRAAMRQALEN